MPQPQKRVGVVGWPIDHSLSPVMHNAAFEALNMTDWLYDAMAIPPDIADYAVKEPKRHGYIGLNVTIPFKERALEWGRPDEKARAIGAANTLNFQDDTATNTDVDGLIDDLNAHDVPLNDETVLVLGAGGAARAAVYGLCKAGAQVRVVNRTTERAQAMVQALRASGGVQNVTVQTLHEAVQEPLSLIVNATSAGMHPHTDSTPWQSEVPFPGNVTLYDMVYTPAETRLMQQCQAAGGRAISGVGMLVRQGAAAFKLWTGVQPPFDVMLNAVRQQLAERNPTE